MIQVWAKALNFQNITISKKEKLFLGTYYTQPHGTKNEKVF